MPATRSLTVCETSTSFGLAAAATRAPIETARPGTTAGADLPQLITDRMALLPLPAQAAAALPEDRQEASRILDAKLPSEWPASQTETGAR